MNDNELRQIIREELSPVHEAINRNRELLTGNGSPSKGVVVRLDRLEQSEARRGKWIGTATGAAIVAAVGSIWALITGRA